MDVQFLEDIGLSKTQAGIYLALIESGPSTAPVIASVVGESRTNTYKVLDKLCDSGLAIKEDSKGKNTYAAASPACLEEFVARQAAVIHQKERRLKAELPRLLDYYFAHSERPTIRYYEGVDGLTKIFKDQLAVGEPVYYVRANSDIEVLGFDLIHYLKNLFPRQGIHRYGITQDIIPSPIAKDDRYPIDKSDAAMLVHRTLIEFEDYTAPVEWSAYGNKLSIISYGNEVIGTVIESPQIAGAFRQLFKLLDKEIRRRPDYSEYPRTMLYTATPESVKKARKTTSRPAKTS